MFKDALKMKIEELTKEREEIFEQIEPLQNKVVSLYNEIESLKSKLAAIEREEMDHPEMSEDQRIAFYLENDGDTKGMEHYKAKEKFWQDMGLWPSGYYPSIQQQGLKVMLYVNKSKNQQTIDIINKVLPHMKTIEGIDDERPNIKVFGIFEYTLSEYGSYSLFFDTDREEWVVSIISWHRRRDVYVTKSLENVIEFISENHAYDGNDYDEDY
jgi:hypothetical protein